MSRQIDTDDDLARAESRGDLCNKTCCYVKFLFTNYYLACYLVYKNSPESSSFILHPKEIAQVLIEP